MVSTSENNCLLGTEVDGIERYLHANCSKIENLLLLFAHHFKELFYILIGFFIIYWVDSSFSSEFTYYKASNLIFEFKKIIKLT